MIKTVVTILFAAPMLAHAADFPTVPSVVSCLKATATLTEPGYKIEMQTQCVGIAAKRCAAAKVQNPSACITALTDEMHRFNTDLLTRLPSSISGTGFTASGYKHVLERAKETLSEVDDCSDLTDDEYRYCAYIPLGATTIDLITLAKGADVPWP